MACSKGDKPIITYKFSNGNNRIYQSDFSPIDVITKTAPVESSDKWSEEGYDVTIRSTQFSGGVGTRTVRDYMTFSRGNALYVVTLPCGQSDYPRDENGDFAGLIELNNGNPAITIDNSKKCPGIPPTTRCSLQIIHNGQVLFQDQGNCPVTYSVQCGKCPPGKYECYSPIYPGYCCLDCASTAASIRNITNDLKVKNG